MDKKVPIDEVSDDDGDDVPGLLDMESDNDSVPELVDVVDSDTLPGLQGMLSGSGPESSDEDEDNAFAEQSNQTQLAKTNSSTAAARPGQELEAEHDVDDVPPLSNVDSSKDSDYDEVRLQGGKHNNNPATTAAAGTREDDDDDSDEMPPLKSSTESEGSESDDDEPPRLPRIPTPAARVPTDAKAQTADSGRAKQGVNEINKPAARQQPQPGASTAAPGAKKAKDSEDGWGHALTKGFLGAPRGQNNGAQNIPGAPLSPNAARPGAAATGYRSLGVGQKEEGPSALAGKTAKDRPAAPYGGANTGMREEGPEAIRKAGTQRVAPSAELDDTDEEEVPPSKRTRQDKEGGKKAKAKKKASAPSAAVAAAAAGGGGGATAGGGAGGASASTGPSVPDINPLLMMAQHAAQLREEYERKRREAGFLNSDAQASAGNACLGYCCLRPGCLSDQLCEHAGAGFRVLESEKRLHISCSRGCHVVLHYPGCTRKYFNALCEHDPSFDRNLKGKKVHHCFTDGCDGYILKAYMYEGVEAPGVPAKYKQIMYDPDASAKQQLADLLEARAARHKKVTTRVPKVPKEDTVGRRSNMGKAGSKEEEAAAQAGDATAGAAADAGKAPAAGAKDAAAAAAGTAAGSEASAAQQAGAAAGAAAGTAAGAAAGAAAGPAAKAGAKGIRIAHRAKGIVKEEPPKPQWEMPPEDTVLLPLVRSPSDNDGIPGKTGSAPPVQDAQQQGQGQGAAGAGAGAGAAAAAEPQEAVAAEPSSAADTLLVSEAAAAGAAAPAGVKKKKNKGVKLLLDNDWFAWPDAEQPAVPAPPPPNARNQQQRQRHNANAGPAAAAATVAAVPAASQRIPMSHFPTLEAAVAAANTAAKKDDEPVKDEIIDALTMLKRTYYDDIMRCKVLLIECLDVAKIEENHGSDVLGYLRANHANLVHNACQFRLFRQQEAAAIEFTEPSEAYTAYLSAQQRGIYRKRIQPSYLTEYPSEEVLGRLRRQLEEEASAARQAQAEQDIAGYADDQIDDGFGYPAPDSGAMDPYGQYNTLAYDCNWQQQQQYQQQQQRQRQQEEHKEKHRQQARERQQRLEEERQVRLALLLSEKDAVIASQAEALESWKAAAAAEKARPDATAVSSTTLDAVAVRAPVFHPQQAGPSSATAAAGDKPKFNLNAPEFSPRVPEFNPRAPAFKPSMSKPDSLMSAGGAGDAGAGEAAASEATSPAEEQPTAAAADTAGAGSSAALTVAKRSSAGASAAMPAADSSNGAQGATTAGQAAPADEAQAPEAKGTDSAGSATAAAAAGPAAAGAVGAANGAVAGTTNAAAAAAAPAVAPPGLAPGGPSSTSVAAAPAVPQWLSARDVVHICNTNTQNLAHYYSSVRFRLPLWMDTASGKRVYIFQDAENLASVKERSVLVLYNQETHDLHGVWRMAGLHTPPDPSQPPSAEFDMLQHLKHTPHSFWQAPLEDTKVLKKPPGFPCKLEGTQAFTLLSTLWEHSKPLTSSTAAAPAPLVAAGAAQAPAPATAAANGGGSRVMSRSTSGATLPSPPLSPHQPPAAALTGIPVAPTGATAVVSMGAAAGAVPAAGSGVTNLLQLVRPPVQVAGGAVPNQAQPPLYRPPAGPAGPAGPAAGPYVPPLFGLLAQARGGGVAAPAAGAPAPLVQPPQPLVQPPRPLVPQQAPQPLVQPQLPHLLLQRVGGAQAARAPSPAHVGGYQPVVSAVAQQNGTAPQQQQQQPAATMRGPSPPLVQTAQQPPAPAAMPPAATHALSSLLPNAATMSTLPARPAAAPPMPAAPAAAGAAATGVPKPSPPPLACPVCMARGSDYINPGCKHMGPCLKCLPDVGERKVLYPVCLRKGCGKPTDQLMRFYK